MPEMKALAVKTKMIRKVIFHETQLEFAQNCGISPDELSDIENQHANPRLTTLQNIAAYTGLTVSELLDVKEDDQS